MVETFPSMEKEFEIQMSETCRTPNSHAQKQKTKRKKLHQDM